MFSRRLSLALIIVYVMVQLLSTVAIIVLQLDARANRQAIRQQNNFTVCVLQVQPTQRTEATVQACRDKSFN